MAAKGEPAPQLYTAAGNINHAYESLGVVMAIVSRQEDWGGGLPVAQAMQDVTNLLKRKAAELGANGLIHISYMHRVSASSGCFGTKANIELYAWGTAIKL